MRAEAGQLQCNWKLFVENHVDVYHLWYLHVFPNLPIASGATFFQAEVLAALEP